MYNTNASASTGVGNNNSVNSNSNYMAEYPYQQNQLQQQLAQQQQQLQQQQLQLQQLQQSQQSQLQLQQQLLLQNQLYGYNSNQGRISNDSISNKFSPQDIQVLRQLLGPGEKHKWKQITKDINQNLPNNKNDNSAGQDKKNLGQAKNVSPTFVIKQYQTLLGLPNNALYFGTLGSSLPYVASTNGWDDIEDQAYNHQFSDYMK